MKYHKLPNVEVLSKLYKTKSTCEIAKEYGSTQRAVSTKLKRAGIKIRSLKESKLLKANRIFISEGIKELVEGLLLGDGSINYSPSKKSFCYRHTDKHESYLVFLMKRFNKLNIDCLGIYEDKKGYYHFSTKYYRDFLFFRKKWYPKNKKIIPLDIKITPTMLKFWYIGDGSFDKKSSSFKITIANDRKNVNRDILIKELKRIGLKISVYSDSFFIRKESWELFFKYMLSKESEIPPSYEYKFPKELICH